MPALGLALGLPYGKMGLGFTGALDAYTSGMVELYSPFRRLLASYTGNAIRVRRSSDNALAWIPFKADGTFDAVAYAAHVGGGNGFAHTVPGQLNARDQVQATAAAQPQIGVDGNGDYYLYAPGAGFTTTSMRCTGLSLSLTDSTMWSVAGAAGYAFAPIGLRDNSAFVERNFVNYSNVLQPNYTDSGSGTVASISGTNTSVYSTIWSVGAGGNKLSNRLSTTTGTRTSTARTVNDLYIGVQNGGPTWAQNSPWYLSAFWSEDKGASADFAALATLGKTLITAAQ